MPVVWIVRPPVLRHFQLSLTQLHTPTHSTCPKTFAVIPPRSGCSPTSSPAQGRSQGSSLRLSALFNVPLRRFDYLIAFFGLAFIAFCAWRITQWEAEVGGWCQWNLALGERQPGDARLNPDPTGANSAKMYRADAGGREEGKPTVEDRIAELAAALGMPSSDLAAAIADAVREHVPPVGLSSVAVHEPSG
ncbi:hypothetical protein C8Q74DRAFT_1213945 [Fomes fomentarius]|nr:hypothetical protein C8Q74DRAFT_1213945 [Fomes fomentarius]